MKGFPAVLALFLFVVSASAQEFPGADELPARVRAQSQRLMSLAQAPAAHAMGDEIRSRIGQASSPSTPPDVSSYPVRGIDVSHYQGPIDWGKVKADGISFAYIKATEGSDGVDARFAENWKGAADAGLARGAYHFYTFCRTGAEQADDFIRSVPADDGALPMTVDLEMSDDCHGAPMPEKAAFRKDLADFAAKIEAAYGRAPMLYIGYPLYQKYFKDETDSYKLWIADIWHAAPVMPEGASWVLWQYGFHGRVAGISGEVDQDAFHGTPEELAALARPDARISRR